MAPAMGILAIAAYGIIPANRIVFGSNSSFATSGGYGPNQVASILGMAALLAAFMLSKPKKSGFRSCSWSGSPRSPLPGSRP